MTTPFRPRPCSFVPRVGVPQLAHLGCTSVPCAPWGYRNRRPGEDSRCARLCSGNERQNNLICLSNAYWHAYFPRWFHWSTIQMVQCITWQRMPAHCHMQDPAPLSAICVVGACVEGRSVLNQGVSSTVPCKRPLCGWMYFLEVLWMPRPTRARRDSLLPPLPTMGVPHGGGGAMPFFSTKGATQITSVMNPLKTYWPMAFVLGAAREQRILTVYSRIPLSIQPYSCQCTAVYWKYTAQCLHRILQVLPILYALVRTVNWATTPHMPLTCFSSNHSYHYVYACPSNGDGAPFEEHSRIL